MEKNIRDRNIYILFTVAFVFICGMLGIYNPGGIFDGGTMTTIIIFSIVGIFLILGALIVGTNASKNPFTLATGIYFLGSSFAIIFLILLAYTLISYNFKMFLGILLLGIVYVIVNHMKQKNASGGTIEKIIQYLSDNRMGIAYVIATAALLVSYFAWENVKIKTYKGGDVVSGPHEYIPLNKETIVSNSTILNKGEEINYRYGFSTCIYLDSTAQNVQTSKTYNIINYGSAGNPHIVYDGTALKVLIYDDDGNKNPRVVYEDTNFLLQRWNQVAINYDGGRIDVFVNGELKASQSGDVPYLKYNNLVVGETDGAIGDVKTIIYFKEPIPISTIRSMYKDM